MTTVSSPRDLFRRLPTGVYVITASHGGISGGFTAAWLTQVAFDPLLVALSVNPENATWALIEGSRRFAVNVLKTGQLDLARHFGTASGKAVDKMATVRTSVVGAGLVILSEALAWLDCRLEQQVPAGEHIVTIGRAVAGGVLDHDAESMHYAETGDMDGSAALFPPRW